MAEIISEFIHENEKNYNKLRNNLSQFKNIFQFIYANVYPDIYCLTERRDFDLKKTFHLIFKTYKHKKKLEKTGRNPQDYKPERNESFAFEQKPVETDTFNDQEEKEIKDNTEKIKVKQQEVVIEKTRHLSNKKRPKKIKKTKINCGST